MTGPAPRRRPSGCTVLLGCAGATAAGTFVVVRTVTAWVTGHPWVVIVVAACAAAGWTLGGWLQARHEARQQRRGPPPPWT